MIRLVNRLWREEHGATAVEYAVLLALIIGVVMGGIGVFGSQTGGLWGGIETDFATAGFGS
jgi:pilus assembly protein Flp/PilA